LTVEWVSNNNNNVDSGFEIEWETTAVPCENFSNPNISNSPMEVLILEKLNALPIAVSNIMVDCEAGAHATFDGTDNTYLGMNEGMVLTTGSATYAFSENDGPGDPETDNNFDTDADLATLSSELSGNQPFMRNACVIEMDVLAASNEIALEYVFGSDEYMGNINNNPTSSDVMGIWISGPGIVGDINYGGQELISVIPGTNTPVHLSTVNNVDNYEYFRYNYLTNLGPRYDGLTTSYFSEDKKTLTASATVEQCSTYHLKIGIADVESTFFGTGDSGLFFGELNVGLPNASLTGTTSFENLVEGCTANDMLNLNLSNPLAEDLTLQVNIAGTATSGADYNLNIPNAITFPAGTTNLSFPITVVNDGMSEGTETIEINCIYDFGCGEFDFATFVITIEDAPNFSAANGQDNLFVCEGESIQLTSMGAVSYSWSPSGTLDNANIANPIATPAVNTVYTVTGTLGSCILTDDVTVEVIDPTININANSTTDLCEGETVMLTANNNVNNAGLSWSPNVGLDDNTLQSPTATPPQTITYTATVSIAGCSVSDQITVNVDPFTFPNLTTTDTVLCLGDSLVLAGSTPGSSTNYSWSPNSDILNSSQSNATAFPQTNTTYTLTTTSQSGFCMETADVNIDVVPATLEIPGGNYYELCIGETVDLSALTSTNGVGFTWSPDSSLTSGTDINVTASPNITTDYIAQLVVGGCTLTELVTVKVDSLPDTSIEAIPMRDTYCKGEVVSFISPSIDIGFFPDMVYEWTPNDGSFISEADNFNLAITADQTQTYTRTITNGGCSNTESITIEVIDINVELNTGDVELCQDETLELEASGADNYIWNTLPFMLSCENCPNPTLSALTSTPISVTGQSEGCSQTITFDLTIAETPICDPILFSPNDTVGIGEAIELNITYTSNSPVTIQWLDAADNVLGQGEMLMTNVNSNENTYTVVVTNANGCSCDEDIDIVGTIPQLIMPNVFTPNGDGINDFFNVMFKDEGSDKIIDKGEIEILGFNIYNRWGNAVYENETPTTGWDGTIDGKSAPSEVYVYVVEIQYPDGTTERVSSDVTLIR